MNNTPLLPLTNIDLTEEYHEKKIFEVDLTPNIDSKFQNSSRSQIEDVEASQLKTLENPKADLNELPRREGTGETIRMEGSWWKGFFRAAGGSVIISMAC